MPANAELFKRILCSIDSSECSNAALQYAMSMAQENDAELFVLYVVPNDRVSQPGQSPDDGIRLFVMGEVAETRTLGRVMRNGMWGLSLLMLVSVGITGQSTTSEGVPASIPAGATALQGLPTVRVDTTVDETKRHTLTAKEANEHGLSITVTGGRYFWTSRRNEELTVRTGGEFTYLTTANPGQYVRLRRIDDRLTYVEHLDMDSRSVTYYGELRIVLGR